MASEKLIKISLDLPESLFNRIKRAERIRGDFSDIIRTGAEKEVIERERRALPTPTEENQLIERAS